jgi:LytS/YehU family sensor histidine kinase
MQVLNHEICKQRATKTIILFKVGYNHDHLSSLCTFVANTCAIAGEKVTKLSILSIFGSRMRSQAALENFQASITSQLIPVNNVCKLLIVFLPKICHIAGGASWSFCALLKV